MWRWQHHQKPVILKSPVTDHRKRRVYRKKNIFFEELRRSIATDTTLFEPPIFGGFRLDPVSLIVAASLREIISVFKAKPAAEHASPPAGDTLPMAPPPFPAHPHLPRQPEPDKVVIVGGRFLRVADPHLPRQPEPDKVRHRVGAAADAFSTPTAQPAHPLYSVRPLAPRNAPAAAALPRVAAESSRVRRSPHRSVKPNRCRLAG